MLRLWSGLGAALFHEKMRCIFCKLPSDLNKSVEHIIPKSLGNDDHVLKAGWVCDACNNYFARKVEAPFMNSEYGKLSRFEMGIPSRRGRTPIVSGFHFPSGTKVDLQHTEHGLSFSASTKQDEIKFISSLRSQPTGSFLLPASDIPELTYDVARFIGMVALEVLAYRCVDLNGWNDEIVDNESFDELRSYVRRGRPGFIWPVHIRRIYPAANQFSDEITPSFQVLNEFDLLCFQSDESSEEIREVFAVIAILGIEYAISLGTPGLESYLSWLDVNNHISYLYSRTKTDQAEQ